MRELKVGLLVLTALTALAVGIFLVGEESSLFKDKNRYFTKFDNVEGLAAGNPVQLNGVNVGKVDDIVLPEKVDEELLTIWISIDGAYADRVRENSAARIKTLGLLGDKYIELTSGSADAPPIPDGGEIPAGQDTELDELLASGGSAMDNLLAISASLRTILARMEAGEGVLGELTADSETGREVKERVLNILASGELLVRRAEEGHGALGALLTDDQLATDIRSVVATTSEVLAEIQDGPGLAPALLRDAATRERFDNTLANLDRASERLAVASDALADPDGLLGRLLQDEAYGAELLDDLGRMIDNLSAISEKLDEGDGTLGQLINDPSVYHALNDVVVGVNESKLLRWLVRNRQKKGIEQRYEEEAGTREPPDEAAAEGGR